MIRQGRSWSGHEKNCCFLNLGSAHGGQQFANISGISGLDYADDSRAVSVVDWDHDGDLDLWVRNRNAPRLRFFRNEVGRSNGSFLAIRLIGNGVTTNRDAIGARVEVIMRGQSGHKLVKTVRAGESFLSQNSTWLHFGLGQDAAKIDAVMIRWPDADQTVETINGLHANRRYVVTQGGGWKESPGRDRALLAIQPGAVTLPEPETALRVPAVTLVSAPRIRGRDFEGNELVTDSIGRWTLVNVWASWCSPCVAELEEFVQRAEDINDAGIRLIALSVDGVGANDGDAKSTVTLLRGLKFPFEAGFASEQFLDELQETADFLTAASEPLSLPFSLLMDPENRVTVMYRGKASVDMLLHDTANPRPTRLERWMRAAPLGGRTIDHPHIRATADSLEATFMYRMGRRFEDNKNYEVARYYYQQAVDHWPDFPEAQRRLRTLHDRP